MPSSRRGSGRGMGTRGQGQGRGGDARGSGRGGRGRGGSRATDLRDYTNLAMDYSDFSVVPQAAQVQALPTPIFAYINAENKSPSTPRTPSTNSPGASGYNTPKTGLRGGSAQSGSRAGNFSSRSSQIPAFSKKNAYANAGQGQYLGHGSTNALLIPVNFVRASSLPPGLEGEKMGVVGELVDQVMQGNMESADAAQGGSAAQLAPKSKKKNDNATLRPTEIQYEAESLQDIEGCAASDNISRDEPILLPHLPPPLECTLRAIRVSEQHVLDLPVNSTLTNQVRDRGEKGEGSSDGKRDDKDDEERRHAYNGLEKTKYGEKVEHPGQLGATAVDPRPLAAKNTTSVSTLLVTSLERRQPPDVECVALTSEETKKDVVNSKLTKSQRRKLKAQGKKARKRGFLHARSGNRHLLANGDLSAENTSEDGDDVEQGNLILTDMGLIGLDGDTSLAASVQHPNSEPRVGDSDLEWGESGPPVIKMVRRSGEGLPLSRKDFKKLARKEIREKERLERLSIGAREEVFRTLSTTGGTSTADTLSAPRSPYRKKTFVHDLAMDDYLENVANGALLDGDSRKALSEEGAEISMEEEMSQKLRNMLGIVEGPYKEHQTLADLEDVRKAERDEADRDTGAWNTTDDEDGVEYTQPTYVHSTGSSNAEGQTCNLDSDELASSDCILEMDIALGEADAQVELAMSKEENLLMAEGESDDHLLTSDSDEDAAFERALLSGSKIRLSAMGVGGGGGRRERKEKKRAKKGKARLESSSEEETSDGDEFMFNGQSTWADDDEDFIRGLQQIMEENADLLGQRDRKKRKQLFKAIEEGDFREYGYHDENFSASRRGKNGKEFKSKGPPFSGVFSAELETQWNKDRSKKTEYKRQRALERAQSEQQVAQRKKKGFQGSHTDLSELSSDASALHLKMRDFIMFDISATSLALPPMSKKSRVAVHLLAEVYGLKSKSMGKGKARFPLLERTNKTGVHGVDERKVRAILRTAEGERAGGWGGGKATGRMGGLWAALQGEPQGKTGRDSSRGGAKHREGAVVGQGADKIDSTNKGYALLHKMGWTEGSSIGISGGISDPIAARIKTNKSGLGGGGYSITRTEANLLATSNDQW